MGREPTTERGRRSRKKIVEAASALIDDCGVTGAGIDRILAAAGASKSQLYHFFGDKSELVRAVIADRMECLVEANLPRLTRLDSWSGIRAWLDEHVELTEAADFPGCPIGNLAAQITAHDEAARADLAECFTGMQSYLTRGLETMRDRGEIVADADPEQLALAVQAGIQGGTLLARTHRDVRPLRAAVDGAYTYLRTFATS